MDLTFITKDLFEVSTILCIDYFNKYGEITTDNISFVELVLKIDSDLYRISVDYKDYIFFKNGSVNLLLAR